MTSFSSTNMPLGEGEPAAIPPAAAAHQGEQGEHEHAVAAGASTPIRRNTSTSHPPQQHSGEEDWTEQLSVQFEDKIGKPSREAIHSFFYPHRSDIGGSQRGPPGPPPAPQSPSQQPPPQSPGQQQSPQRRSNMSRSSFDEHFEEQAQQDQQFVNRFWTAYDDILILSLFTQLGIIFRLASAVWFAYFDNVFSPDSALFVNLPLNCLSCFLMGCLCSGERLMEIIGTRFSPPRLQQRILAEDVGKSNRQSRRSSSRRRLDGNSGGGEDSDEDSDEENAIHPAPSGLISPFAARRSSSHSFERPYCTSDEEEEDHDDEMEAERMEIGDSYSSTGGILRRRRGGRRKRRRKKSEKYFHHWEPPVQLNQDLRDVQLLALERRIRASKCLLLFPVRKEDVDVMEHYFQEGYKRKRGRGRWDHDDSDFPEENHQNEAVSARNSAVATGIEGDFTYDLELQVMSSQSQSSNNEMSSPPTSPQESPPAKKATPDSLAGSIPAPPVSDLAEESAGDSRTEPRQMATVDLGSSAPAPSTRRSNRNTDTLRSSSVPGSSEGGNTSSQGPDEQAGVDQMLTEVTANVSENISRLRRVNLADGWDSGTTPEAMSDDLMLGLRAGFCGALSSFSSWNSAMVNLMKKGEIGTALVGYMLGLQLPIIAYRFGQHVAVYIFVWRCRFESSRDERRGYGIRVSMNETSERDGDIQNGTGPRHRTEEEIPSVRAIITAIFIMALVTQCTSLSFFSDPEHQQIALSLLFSPLGVLARWRLSRLNSWRPTFPLGTFTANILACALSGGLGRLLAGEPGPRERIALVSIIAGFAGTMSSLAIFIVEILAGIDPVLFRFDGMIYAALSLFWAMVVAFVFSTSVDWADATE